MNFELLAGFKLMIQIEGQAETGCTQAHKGQKRTDLSGNSGHGALPIDSVGTDLFSLAWCSGQT